MGNSAVKEHCETAKKTGVFRLSQKRISEFPADLYNIKSYLRILDLSDNRLTTLPSNIDYFENLKHLKVNKNRLALLPENIGRLQKLENLSVCDNEIRGLPQSLLNLTRLKEVSNIKNLSSICITKFLY